MVCRANIKMCNKLFSEFDASMDLEKKKKF